MYSVDREICYLIFPAPICNLYKYETIRYLGIYCSPESENLCSVMMQIASPEVGILKQS